MSVAADLSPPTDSPVDAPSAAGTALGADAPPPKRSWSVAPLLMRLHFYAGILVAPFLVIAAMSGLAFVFTPQMDAIAYRHEFTVDTVTGAPRPLAEQVAAAVTAHPEGTVASVIPPSAPEATTRVVFNVEGLGENQHTVFVDPYTNEVRGTLTTWFGETPIMTWFDDLHRNLHLGDLGRHYSELAASWIWVLVLGGLVLWLRRQRGRANKIRSSVLPDLAARKGGVRRTRSWHAVLGLWLALGLLVLSATGLTWSRYAGGNFGIALEALDAQRPEISADAAAGSGGHHTGGGQPAPTDPSKIDAVVATARSAGLSGPLEVTVPEPGDAWVVAQTDNVWPVRFDRVAIDTTGPAGTTITDRSDFADWPLFAQLSSLGVHAHMGFLFGILNQLALATLGIGLLFMIFWGYKMWWQRRPTRTDRSTPLGTPPPRGGWLRLPAWMIATGVPLVIALGVAIPLFGVTLAAFLLIDLILAATRKRNTTKAAPVPATD